MKNFWKSLFICYCKENLDSKRKSLKREPGKIVETLCGSAVKRFSPRTKHTAEIQKLDKSDKVQVRWEFRKEAAKNRNWIFDEGALVWRIFSEWNYLVDASIYNLGDVWWRVSACCLQDKNFYVAGYIWGMDFKLDLNIFVMRQCF